MGGDKGCVSGLVNIVISQLPVPALALSGTAVLGLVGSARCHRVCPVKGLRTVCHHLLLETKPIKSKGVDGCCARLCFMIVI